MKKTTVVKKAAAPAKRTYIKKYKPRYKRGFATGQLLANTKRTELKYWDVSSGNSALLPSAPLTFSVCAVDNGTADNEMVGSRIVVKSVWVKLLFQSAPGYQNYPAGLTQPDEIVRVMIVWDKQWNSAAALDPDDLLEDYSISSFLPPYNVWSMVDRLNKQRYEILTDELIDIKSNIYPFYNPGGAGQVQMYSQGISRSWEKYHKVNIPVDSTYSTNKSPAQLKTSNIFVFLQAQNGILTTVMMNSRIRFTDQ